MGTTLVLSRYRTESHSFFIPFFKNGIRCTKVTQLLCPTILIALDIPFFCGSFPGPSDGVVESGHILVSLSLGRAAETGL